MKDDFRYTPSDCFETFPFPKNFETDSGLEAAASAYYEFRAALMVRNNEGLTKTYNRFHDPDERSPDILELARTARRDGQGRPRRLRLDRPQPTCEFLLDYEDDEEDDEESAGRPPQEEALALPLARRLPRRSPRPPPRTQSGADRLAASLWFSCCLRELDGLLAPDLNHLSKLKFLV